MGFQVFDNNGGLQLSDFAIDITLSNIVTINDKKQSLISENNPITGLTAFKPLGNGFSYMYRGHAQLYHFSKRIQNDTPRFGLQVFDENGQKTYDSNAKSINVIDEINISYDHWFGNTPISTITFTKRYPNRQIAILLKDLPWVALPPHEPNFSYWVSPLFRFENNTLYISKDFGLGPPMGHGLIHKTNVNFLVLDVSNY